MRIPAVALLAASAIVTAGCGGGSSGGSSQTAETSAAPKASTPRAGAVDACSLVTTREVAAAGVPGAKPVAGTAATGGVNCNFAAKGKFPPQNVTVIVNTAGGKSYYDQLKALAKSPKDISGLGDAAYVESQTTPVQSSTVALYRGNLYLSVGGSISAKAAQSLAAKALSRVP
jgi:Protein of unknown function (DUF3558)